MKETGIILICTFMLYIQSTSTLIISHEHHEENVTDIPARSEDNRMLNGKTLEYSAADENIAQIYYPHYPNPDDPTLIELWCRGVRLTPIFVVTVAHCFDVVILSKTDRRRFSNFVIHFKQIKSKSFTGRLAWVGFGRNKILGHGTYVQLDKLFIHDQYDIRYDQNNEVDVAMIELRNAHQTDLAMPSYKISTDLEADSSRMYPKVQDCWVVSAGHTSPDEVLAWDDKPLLRMRVHVGNGKYCLVLEHKLYRGKKHFMYNEEYLCASTDAFMNPHTRLCTGDDGAALVCRNGYLFGLLSRRHDSGKCNGKNTFGKYVYLGNRHVYEWLIGITSRTFNYDDVYRSDGSKESASGLVAASKAVTWVLTLISVAVTLNTYY